MKRDQNIIKTTKKWLSGTIIFEEIKSKRIPVKGQSSDSNNKLNNNVAIFGNVSFGWKLISFTAVLNIVSPPIASRRHSCNCGVLPYTCCFFINEF